MITRLITGQVVRLYRAGRSLRQIGKMIGISHATVRKRLIDAGVTLRQRGGDNCSGKKRAAR